MFKLWRFAVAFALPLVLPIAAHAQAPAGTVTERQNLINWYYAATFGTGTYTAGDRSVTVLQLPFSRALQTVEEDGIGLKFKLSATLDDAGIDDGRHDEQLGRR